MKRDLFNRSLFNKKNKFIHFRVTAEEHEQIRELASSRGVNMTKFVLDAIRSHIWKKR